MQVGDLVRMTDDPDNLIGIITEIIDDTHRNDKIYYKVSWLHYSSYNLNSSYADEDVLEVISESR